MKEDRVADVCTADTLMCNHILYFGTDVNLDVKLISVVS